MGCPRGPFATEIQQRHAHQNNQQISPERVRIWNGVSS